MSDVRRIEPDEKEGIFIPGITEGIATMMCEEISRRYGGGSTFEQIAGGVFFDPNLGPRRLQIVAEIAEEAGVTYQHIGKQALVAQIRTALIGAVQEALPEGDPGAGGRLLHFQIPPDKTSSEPE